MAVQRAIILYGKKCFEVKKSLQSKSISKFPQKALLWQAICLCCKRSKHFITSGSIISHNYIKECIKKVLLLFIIQFRDNSDKNPLFWLDLASFHYSKKAIKCYNNNNIRVIPRDSNPANCPELRSKDHLKRTKKVPKV